MMLDDFLLKQYFDELKSIFCGCFGIYLIQMKSSGKSVQYPTDFVLIPESEHQFR